MRQTLVSQAGTTVRALYDLYPDFDIDIAAERAALTEADLVIWLTPVHWYSVPALMKHWIDQVLAYGWAYGPDGNALRGKTVWWVTSAGAMPADYSATGAHGRPFADFRGAAGADRALLRHALAGAVCRARRPRQFGGPGQRQLRRPAATARGAPRRPRRRRRTRNRRMTQAILFLLAALIFVPLAVRAGLGSVLGYLVAGMVIGPVGFALVSDPAAILHVSELGVVLMLFVIGLELEPQRLWAMRSAVFGGGALQMLLCASLLMPVGLMIGWTWQASLVAALALALSSTAIAVAILQERNLMARPVGQTGFAMLLFQDIAAIPLLALAAVLGTAAPAATESGHGAAHSGGVLLQIAAVVGVIVFGRFVAYPLMRYIARINVRELFTGFALLLVLGVAALMEYVGLSMGLGAFLAGVLLASSEYRHALENDILPFKGLLLGLFFIAVGMSMQLGLLLTAPLQVIVGLVLVVALKALGLWLLGPVVKLTGSQRSMLAIVLSQVGEFAFVVLAAAKASSVLPSADADLLTLIAALSMVSTPLPADRLRPLQPPRDQRPPGRHHRRRRVAGAAGRLRPLRPDRRAQPCSSAGIKPTVIDHDADTVDSARRFGFKVHFGDASQPDLLHAAGVGQARAFVIAIDDAAQATRLAHELPRVAPRSADHRARFRLGARDGSAGRACAPRAARGAWRARCAAPAPRWSCWASTASTRASSPTTSGDTPRCGETGAADCVRSTSATT